LPCIEAAERDEDRDRQTEQDASEHAAAVPITPPRQSYRVFP
jgi:hypothetical protein